jgi:hypothetical protein
MATPSNAEKLREAEAEIERAHTALATLRKLALEQPTLSPSDVVEAISKCNVDTSKFAELAAGV